MATLTRIQFDDEPNALDIAGHADTDAAAGGGDQFLNTGNTGFWVQNTSGSPRTVTFNAANACDHGFTHDAAVVVADGFEGFIASRLNAQRFNDDSGYVQVTYSAATGLLVAAVRLDG